MTYFNIELMITKKVFVKHPIFVLHDLKSSYKHVI